MSLSWECFNKVCCLGGGEKKRGHTLFSSFVNESVASMNFRFLSWWRSSIWSNSASNFLCGRRQPETIVTKYYQHNMTHVCKYESPKHNYCIPGEPSKTGPDVWGLAYEQLWQQNAHQAQHSHWESHWSAGGCAENGLLRSALLKTHHHNLGKHGKKQKSWMLIKPKMRKQYCNHNSFSKQRWKWEM